VNVGPSECLERSTPIKIHGASSVEQSLNVDGLEACMADVVNAGFIDHQQSAISYICRRPAGRPSVRLQCSVVRVI